MLSMLDWPYKNFSFPNTSLYRTPVYYQCRGTCHEVHVDEIELSQWAQKRERVAICLGETMLAHLVVEKTAP